MAEPHVDTSVLHVLRVKGFAETDVVAEVTRLDDVTVVRSLEALAADGLVRRQEGVDVSGWVLTPQGRSEHEKRLAAELDAVGTRAGVEHEYATFTELNPVVLQVLTDWQLRGGVVNDHADAAHDADVVERLVEVHRRAVPMLAGLTAALSRFQGYALRLQRAVDEVRAGHGEWVDKPLIDSFHSVWFELHEDLLATLGLERSAETGGAA